MTNGPAPSEKSPSTFHRADEWAARFVRLCHLVMIVAASTCLVAWAVKSTIREHLAEFVLCLVPLSVSVALVALPRGNKLRALWSVAALVVSPAVIVYLMLEASAAFVNYKSQSGEVVPLPVWMWAGDLVLWMFLWLIFLAMVNEQHFRSQRKLGETHDAYVELQSQEKDNRIVILEQTVASLKRRLFEKDGY